jgi:hypothetical protein
MAEGAYEGRDIQHPDVRCMFAREAVLASEWYRDRLARKRRIDINLWERHVANLEAAREAPVRLPDAELNRRLEAARSQLERVRRPEYVDDLVGTIGA